MSEATSETTTEGTGGESGFTPPATQEEYQAAINKVVAERLAREKAKFADYGDLKSKAEQFDALSEAQKSEVQKANERAEAAERALSESQSQSLRLSVIARHQIPEDLQEFVIGQTEEELEARAEKVKTLIPAPATQEPAMRELFVAGEGHAPALALNGDGLEAALKSKLGIG